MNRNFRRSTAFIRALCGLGCLLAFFLSGILSARGEAMLELFNVSWADLTVKMPEIAEAGYDSLWVPNPGKGNSGVASYGYDMFDPFDLGSTNQQGTVATRWGTQAQLIQMVQTAHRFGIRVYFDNVMNHRSSTVPGYPGSGVSTNYYPGLIPQDFHLQTVSGGFKNWPDVGNGGSSDWCNPSIVQNQPLLGLCDLAQEPGTVNWNFGNNIGNTITKPHFIRFPTRPDLYMDTNRPAIGGGWHPFDGQGQPVPEYVQDYLDRAVMWTLYITKCDGFRLDAVKHVPAGFFGAETGQTDDPSFAGYTGGIQAMYDYVHGYGANVTGNGYVETDGNRNSVFDTEVPRNDAMIFGEHVAPAPPYYDYLQSGMRLINQPLYNQMNGAFNGSGSLASMDGRDFQPGASNCDGSGNFSMAQGVNFPLDQDYGVYANLTLEDSYLFMHEGLPMVYADGFNHNPNSGTPVVSYANYLGEFGDNSLPDTMYLHNQLSRGGTRSRWSDQNIIAFERYDYRDVDPPALYGNAYTNGASTVVFYAMNDATSYPGDIAFDDGISRSSDGYYLVSTNTADGSTNADVYVSNSRAQGIAVGFPPGTLLTQLSSSGDVAGGNRAFHRLLVHGATTNYQAAVNSANAADPSQRLIYVNGQTITPGGGAIELVAPSGGWVMYGEQWPEASRANPSTNAIIFRQGGVEVPHITIYRQDGTNGDAHYNPLFPFKMRGSVDAFGSTIAGANVSNLTYAIDVPIVTNANFDIIARSDASSAGTLLKLDGGVDLNSQMGLGATTSAITNFLDLRDHPPGYADDVYLGYEQTALQFRNGPEKFAARNIASNNIVSVGAETYYYLVGGASNVVTGAGYGATITNQTANWVWHDPTNSVTSLSANPPSQRNPLGPAAGQSVDLWVKVGYQFETNTCFIYYTTDGSNPEGAFGIGKGTTQVVQGFWVNHDSAQSTVDWWKGTIPAQPNGTQVRYKIALYNGGSTNAGQSIPAISYAEPSGAKYYGLTQSAITNFNPATAVVWLHNDLNTNNTTIGLQPGFHIVRARTFLPVMNVTNQNYVYATQAQVYNTFLQTFYYDGALPAGAIAYPANSTTINSATYTVVVRADSTVTGIDFNIQDSNSTNDDIVTGQQNGNGNGTNGSPIFVSAASVTPDPTLDATYTNLPQEYRFVYANVPRSGTATISVRLKEYGTSIYTNRYTMLTTTVNTLAPVQTLEFSSPATNNTILNYASNATYIVQACFSSTLNFSTNNFNLLINGALQPQASYVLRHANLVAACPGLASLTYSWNNPTPGTNLIQVVYTNAGVTLSDSRMMIVAPPPVISGLSNNHQQVVWQSAPGVNYSVLATTNLLQPFQNISGVVPSSGASSDYFDTNPAPQKFYEVIIVP